MPEFLCLQRSVPHSAQPDAETTPSPTDMQDLYSRFETWKEQFSDHLSDLGGRLGNGEMVSSAPIDGPFVEVQEIAGGYMVLSAENLEQAVEIARQCPGLVRPGSGVEVIEIQRP